MRKGKRFTWFWIFVFTMAGSGCAGCGDCFGGGGDVSCNIADNCDEASCAKTPVTNGKSTCQPGFFSSTCGPVCDPGFAACNGTECETNIENDPRNCGACNNVCASGVCTMSRCDVDLDASLQIPLVTGLDAPAGLATDGVYVYYVNDEVLTLYDPQQFESAVPIAVGVVPNGGIVAEDSYVFWAGQWNGNVDAGDASDAGDGGAMVQTTGIFRVSVTTGVVELLAPLDANAGVAFDIANVYARSNVDDAGTSELGFVPKDGGGFSPLASLSGNTGNIHAFAQRTDDIVALDNSDIVSVLLDGGGKSLLVPDAGASALLPTIFGAVDMTAADGSFALQTLDYDGGAALLGVPGSITSHDRYTYVANETTGEIDQLFGPDFTAFSLTTVADGVSGHVPFIAADDNYVYWIAGGGLYRAAVP